MTTEGNPFPRRQLLLYGRLAVGIAATLLSALGLWVSVTAILDHRFEMQQNSMSANLRETRNKSASGMQETRNPIQGSEANRQAEARPINARVDAAEQLVVATLPYRCPPLG